MTATHARPPSSSALRLLAALKDSDRPLTDRILASRLGLPQRELIDLADELLAHGLPVVADGRGRWLGDAADLDRYIAALDVRARKVFVRRQHALAARAHLRLTHSNLWEVTDDPAAR